MKLILSNSNVPVHHLHGSPLPVQDGLHGGRGGVSLGPHRDHHIGCKSVSKYSDEALWVVGNCVYMKKAHVP